MFVCTKQGSKGITWRVFEAIEKDSETKRLCNVWVHCRLCPNINSITEPSRTRSSVLPIAKFCVELVFILKVKISLDPQKH